MTARLERACWKDSRARGAVFTLGAVGSAVALGTGLARLGRHSPWTRTALTALATFTVLGSRSLRREGDLIRTMLEAGDLAAARQRVTHLVSRDPAGLNPAEVARAATESVAENSSDAIVAPLVWGAVAGIPGLLGYRAVNTLDAMVGYRSERYRNFGWASARLDDIANYVPARLTAGLVALVADVQRPTHRDIQPPAHRDVPTPPGRVARRWRDTVRDARRHPSPNSGWCEASYAAALNLQLGGTNRYGDLVEHRPTLGRGAAPGPRDISRASRLTGRVTWAAAAIASGLAAALTRRRTR